MIRTFWTCDVEGCKAEEEQGPAGMAHWNLGLICGRVFVTCPKHKGAIERMQPDEKIKVAKR
jgi:hypothetical protein